MDISDLQKNYPVINQASRDMMALFGERLTQRPGGHIETDISAAASVAGLQILRSNVAALNALPAGKTILYPERAEEMNMIMKFMVGVCEGLDLDPKNGWNVKKPDATHAPLFSIPDMEQRLEKDYLGVCHGYPLGTEFYPYVAILSAMRLVSAGNKLRILDENTGKELALYHVMAGSTTAPYPP